MAQEQPVVETTAVGGVDDHLASLDNISSDVNAEFGGDAPPDKLGVFNAHMATVRMLVEQLYEERARV